MQEIYHKWKQKNPHAKYLFFPPNIHTFSHGKETFPGTVWSGLCANWSQQKRVEYRIFKGNWSYFPNQRISHLHKEINGRSIWSPWNDSLTYEEGQNPSHNIQYKWNWMVGKNVICRTMFTWYPTTEFASFSTLHCKQQCLLTIKFFSRQFRMFSSSAQYSLEILCVFTIKVRIYVCLFVF